MEHVVQQTPERQAFYNKIDGENLSALWNVLGALITPEPKSACQPFLWRFDAIRERMTEAGKLITAKEAERRVLILENPGLRGQSKITTSLYAGIQAVLPGEVAPAHRHTQSALRFVLEGKGAHTAVDGERTMMSPGDFVITPAMTWHDHGNTSSEPMFWLDGLDIPVVQFLDASFAEGLDDEEQPITRPVGDSYARFGHNLLPVDLKRSSKTSPVFSYPYEQTRAALEQMKSEAWDACHGLKLRYTNPVRAIMPCRRWVRSSSFCRKAFPHRAIARPMRPYMSRSKDAGARASATRHSSGSRAIFSSCRVGIRSATRRNKKACSSVSPIGPSRRSSISSVRIAATHDVANGMRSPSRKRHSNIIRVVPGSSSNDIGA